MEKPHAKKTQIVIDCLNQVTSPRADVEQVACFSHQWSFRIHEKMRVGVLFS
jgi:hypothetical protein